MSGADLIVRGRIATFAGVTGFGWAEAVAIRGGRVLSSGRLVDVDAAVGRATRRVDLPPGMIALPGIVDAHLHLADAALAARSIDLEGLDLPAALQALGGAAAPTEGWIVGAGWDPEPLGRWPTAADLESVAPGRRVLLWSHDRHALWVSHAVLWEAGIDAQAADPPGGAIRRGPDGAPTGVLHEEAVGPALALLPPPGQAEIEDAIEAYARGLLALGVVGVHDPAGLDAPDLGAAAIARISDTGRLPIRVQRSVRAPDLDGAIQRGRRTGGPLGDDPDGRARMGWLKLFADGALGSRTALLVDPYEGSDDRGIAVTDRDELLTLVGRAAAAGIAPQIHAIGDAALRAVLDVLESVVGAGGGGGRLAGPMPRIEHVQLGQASDLERFAASGIAASIQPIHLRTDRGKAFEQWGRKRSERDAFRAGSLMAAGAVVAFGTDAPVEPADPWPGIALATTRRAPEWGDVGAFGPQEAVDLATALRAATVGPARIAGDPSGGGLRPGAPADLVVVDEAVLSDADALARASPSLVFVDGEEVFAR